MKCVCLIGRPNTGKSSLFNRLVGEEKSIIMDMPGITRDRIYGEVNYNQKKFSLIDTGGLELGEENFKQDILAQATFAIDESDLILFVVDGKTELNQSDYMIRDILRKSGKEVIVVVNKIDNKERENSIYNFYELGFEQVIGVSATHKLGIKELLNTITEDLGVTEEQEENICRFCFIGRPNTGKSSLVNALLNEERAIVSDLAGTTRDTIEEFIKIRGIPIKIIDTAGIRETENMIESIGVKKAISLIDDADLVIAVFDSSKMLEEEDYRILDLIKNKNRIVLLNKCDLRQNNIEMINYMSQKNKTVIEASMRSKKGVEELYSAIEKMFNVNEIEIGNETIITNIRHKNQIHKAIQSIENAINTVKQELPIDIIAVEIKEALENLGCITGDNVSEDIINEIFSKFCLGK